MKKLQRRFAPMVPAALPRMDGRFERNTQSRKDIREEPAYAAIRFHLSAELVGNIEKQNITGGEEMINKNMMQELSELEKKWNLV